MTRLLLSLALCFQIIITSIAQQPAPSPTASPSANPSSTQGPPPKPPELKPTPPPQEPSDVDVVKITTNLVQIDAVVTDKKGKHVTDLRPDEVEMFEDGKRQTITNFSFIQVQPPAEAAAKPKEKTDPLTPQPPRKLRPDEIHRTIALVVDDLGLSFESAYYMRRALKKFLDEMMQPNDLVAIIRTAGGIGALQQFTTDKRQLYAALEKVKWNPSGRGGISAFAPLREGLPQPPGAQPAETTPEADLEQFREEVFTVGTLGALNYVIRGLGQLPGRKQVVLFSDGLRLWNRSDPFAESRVLGAIRVLLDVANRASVVINTMDARGLQVLELGAADSTANMSQQDVLDRLSQRRADFLDSQQGLDYLAAETGGLSIRNTNDLGAGIKKIVDYHSGYYLIGYRPDDSTFDRDKGRTKFHRVSLKVKRPGNYDVRMRAGFFGVTDDAIKPNQTPRQQLVSALLSPFSSAGVQLRLTSLFANDSKIGSLMRSFLHVKASDLTFTKESDGTHKAEFDILAIIFGDNGNVVGQFSYRQTIRVKQTSIEKVLRNGFTYNVMVPIKKPGAYQLRTALRDLASSKVGSASQFIEVPDIKKDRLLTSGLLLKGMSRDVYLKNIAAAPDEPPDRSVDENNPAANAAVRQFQRGMALLYGFAVYNAKIDKATDKPQLKTQVRLFRNGELVFTGNEIPFEVKNQSDMKRLTLGGAVQLGTAMQPGEYVLQVIVMDMLREEKKRVATQWMDFELVK